MKSYFPSIENWRGALVSKRKVAPIEPPETIDLALERRARRIVRRRQHARTPQAQIITPSATAATCHLSFDSRRIIIKTGKTVTRKKSGRIVPETVCAGQIALAFADVRYGHAHFYFRTTSQGANVYDSRDDTRKPFAFIHAELVRMRLDADAICAHLRTVIAATR